MVTVTSNQSLNRGDVWMRMR